MGNTELDGFFVSVSLPYKPFDLQALSGFLWSQVADVRTTAQFLEALTDNFPAT